MKILLILTICLFNSFSSATLFPGMKCETLNNKIVNLPADVKGKRTVVAIAMSVKAEKELRAWGNPLYQALIADGMGGLMGGRMYNANLCFIGMVHGIAKLATNEIKERTKKATDKKLHDNFMVTESDVAQVMEALNISDRHEPHFFVLDKDGNVIYHTSGAYTDDKLNQITERLL